MVCNETLYTQLFQPVIKVMHPFFQLILPILQRGNSGGVAPIITRWQCIAARTCDLPMHRIELF